MVIRSKQEHLKTQIKPFRGEGKKKRKKGCKALGTFEIKGIHLST